MAPGVIDANCRVFRRFGKELAVQMGIAASSSDATDDAKQNIDLTSQRPQNPLEVVTHPKQLLLLKRARVGWSAVRQIGTLQCVIHEVSTKFKAPAASSQSAEQDFRLSALPAEQWTSLPLCGVF